MTSSDSGKLPQGADGRSAEVGRPGRARGRGAGLAARSRRAASRSARVDSPRLRLRLPIQVANGQPELMTTRHQPMSMPMKLQRGRTCQCLQPRSPMASADTRRHLWRSGSSSISSMRRLFWSSTQVRSESARRASETRAASSSRSSSSSASEAGAARRLGRARPVAACPCGARWRRRPATAHSRAARPGRAASAGRRARR
jgi:hypothetical protein